MLGPPSRFRAVSVAQVTRQRVRRMPIEIVPRTIVPPHLWPEDEDRTRAAVDEALQSALRPSPDTSSASNSFG